MRLILSFTFAVMTLAIARPAAAQTATTSVRPAYGCFKVTSADSSVRDKARSSGAVLATVIKNETLVKRRRFCTLGGTWCAVTTNKGVQGFAEKSAMALAPCPARLSTKVN
jgi:hypothetical protein